MVICCLCAKSNEIPCFSVLKIITFCFNLLCTQSPSFFGNGVELKQERMGAESSEQNRTGSVVFLFIEATAAGDISASMDFTQFDCPRCLRLSKTQ